MSRFTRAIVRTPCRAMVHGITTAGLGAPDYRKALRQHADYVEALKECGLAVRVLPADEDFPDSTFVEDVALLTPSCAVLTRPGARSRRLETRSMLPVLQDYYERVERIAAPGTLEAGDVLMVGSHFYIGLSGRTNPHGAAQLAAILRRYGMTAATVGPTGFLHLKTGLSYLEHGRLLLGGELTGAAEFSGFEQLRVGPEEAYAANAVWINGVVLVADGFPAARQALESAGYPVRAVNVSEFQKLDGGLSCLSLRF